MLILFLLLVPACLGAPPVGPNIHVHAEDTCNESYCRVSNDTLDSALKTFLCMKEDDIKGLREKEKKLVLAQKIAPLLKMHAGGSSVEDLLAEMDTARLVPIVNLVLHDGDAAVEPKTELEYTRALREGIASATSLHPTLFRRTSPIVLGILNCQAKLLSKLHDLVLGAQRDGRSFDNNGFLASIGPLAKIQEELEWFKSVLNFQNQKQGVNSPMGINANDNRKLTNQESRQSVSSSNTYGK